MGTCKQTLNEVAFGGGGGGGSTYGESLAENITITDSVFAGEELFPNSPTPGVDGWSLAGEEVDWDYTSIPYTGETNITGNPYRSYGNGISVWGAQLTAQANSGATQILISAPSDTTVNAVNGAWTKIPTVVSSAGWRPYDEWAIPALSITASAQGGGGAPSGTELDGDVFIAPSALQIGQSVQYVNRLVAGMQLILGGVGGEIVTIASVTDRYTINLTAPLASTHINGTTVNRYFGRCDSLIVDSTKPGGSGKVLDVRFPVGFHGGYEPAKVAHNGFEAGNHVVHWDYTLCTGSIYIAQWRRLSSNWTMQGGRVDGLKTFYLFSRDTPDPDNNNLAHITDYLAARGPDGERLLAQYQPQTPFQAGQIVPDVAANDHGDGNWHLMEMLLTPNTGDNQDGTCTIWLDAHLGGDNLTPKFAGTAAQLFDSTQVRSFDTIDFAAIYGGGQATITAEQWLRFGPVRIMVK
jgi:hypothetical protein